MELMLGNQAMQVMLGIPGMVPTQVTVPKPGMEQRPVTELALELGLVPELELAKLPILATEPRPGKLLAGLVPVLELGQVTLPRPGKVLVLAQVTLPRPGMELVPELGTQQRQCLLPGLVTE